MEKNTWYIDLAPEFDSWFSCWLYFIHFIPHAMVDSLLSGDFIHQLMVA